MFSQGLNSPVHLGWMASYGSKEGLRQESRGPLLWPGGDTDHCMELLTTSAWNHVSERDMEWGTPLVWAIWYIFFYDFLISFQSMLLRYVGLIISSFSFHWCIVLHCLNVYNSISSLLLDIYLFLDMGIFVNTTAGKQTFSCPYISSKNSHRPQKLGLHFNFAFQI